MLTPKQFSPLRIVRIGDASPDLELHCLVERVQRAFGGAIEAIEVVDYTGPELPCIEAELLTFVLAEEIGGHVLGVTAADLVDGADAMSSMFGGKDHRNDVAVVSTARLRGDGGRRTTDRLVKVALHELGHNFGLVHHYSMETGADGGCCPMSKGDYNRFGEVGYLRAVVDQRGFAFCEACSRFVAYRTSPESADC